MGVTNRKLERALEHQKQLTSEMQVYLQTRPFEISTKKAAHSGRLVYFLSRADEIPKSIATLVGDVIQNLRSSLDHKAFDLFCAGSGGNPRDVYFPISMNLKAYEKNKGAKLPGVSKKTLNKIDTIKPYKEGNPRLWQLNELNIIDKHRALIAAGSTFRSVNLGAHAVQLLRDRLGEKIPAIDLLVRPAEVIFPLKVGSVLFEDAPEAVPNPGIQFKFEIVLHEPGIIEKTNIEEFLTEATSEVTRVLNELSN